MGRSWPSAGTPLATLPALRMTCPMVHAAPVPDPARLVFVPNKAVVPAGPVGPAAPASPGGPAGPVAPASPAGPVAPAGPGGPAGPAAPVGPGGPGGPAGPVTPVGPGGPAGPVTPVGPGGPAGPVTPVGPGGPAGPVTPVGPGGPAGPVTPVEPGGPAGPAGRGGGRRDPRDPQGRGLREHREDWRRSISRWLCHRQSARDSRLCPFRLAQRCLPNLRAGRIQQLALNYLHPVVVMVSLAALACLQLDWSAPFPGGCVIDSLPEIPVCALSD